MNYVYYFILKASISLSLSENGNQTDEVLISDAWNADDICILFCMLDEGLSLKYKTAPFSHIIPPG